MSIWNWSMLREEASGKMISSSSSNFPHTHGVISIIRGCQQTSRLHLLRSSVVKTSTQQFFFFFFFSTPANLPRFYFYCFCPFYSTLERGPPALAWLGLACLLLCFALLGSSPECWHKHLISNHPPSGSMCLIKDVCLSLCLGLSPPLYPHPSLGLQHVPNFQF